MQFVPDDLDPEVLELVYAMNQFPGITTTESCCGHGKEPFEIFFMADDLSTLPDLLYWFDGCHTGFYGWSVKVRTDCGKSPVHFCAESEEHGEPAYYQARCIASCLNEERAMEPKSDAGEGE